MDPVAILDLLVLEVYKVIQDHVAMKDSKVKKDYLVTVVLVDVLVQLVMVVGLDCKDYQVPLVMEMIVLNLMELMLTL